MAKIAVLGGSFGGLTAAFELKRLLGKEAELDLGYQKWTPIDSCRNPCLIELLLISNRG